MRPLMESISVTAAVQITMDQIVKQVQNTCVCGNGGNGAFS